jgi:hypothetical protein
MPQSAAHRWNTLSWLLTELLDVAEAQEGKWPAAIMTGMLRSGVTASRSTLKSTWD